MLDDLTGTKYEFILGELVGRELPASYLLCDEKFSLRIDVKITVKRKLVQNAVPRGQNGLPVLEIINDFLRFADSSHKFRDHGFSQIRVGLFIMDTHPRVFAQFFPRQEAGHFLLGGSTCTIGMDHQALDSGAIEGRGQDIGRTCIEASRNLLVFQRDRVPTLRLTCRCRRGLARRIRASGA